jgi:pSer/pThr/pTyr-binding forkhead associated (FHA) protein
VVVDNDLVSSRHFELRVVKVGDEKHLLLVDGGDDPTSRSTNGTFVNGIPMTGKFQWVQPGNRITAYDENFIVGKPASLLENFANLAARAARPDSQRLERRHADRRRHRGGHPQGRTGEDRTQ